MEDLENWEIIQDFPLYLVSDFGRIANEKTGRVLRESLTRSGIVKVGLIFDGIQYTRAVCVLVAEAFVEGQDEICDTVIHLNRDSTNNHAYNLVWRPRGFAHMFKRQFEKTLIGNSKLSIYDKETNQIYPTVVEAAMMNGLLIEDIWRSVVRGGSTFPTGQRWGLTT